ncbi:Centrosomal protein of 192 kDa [Takifugu flavidus]|uniref:Centrosomal protein of 192 kDa n=1 Tax=Takifugu flavidus TaxID=433684 RepID=A0A5C6PLV8_9TELE|nr:Centrosomal protein of 192 kDa [Takifugu flavidus]
MADSFYKLEDEAFPSFLSKSLDSTSGRATLGNVTLGSGPGLPVAASTVAKIKPASENRGDAVEASYLEGRDVSLQSPEQPNFALSLKDDLDTADNFIAAHRLSDMLVKINLDESASRNQGSTVEPPPTQMRSSTQAQALLAEEDPIHSDEVDSDRFSGSNSSFLANEKLMSMDSMNSDITDDDSQDMPDDEMQLYFNKLVPPVMQRGRVEGQEIPATGLLSAADDLPKASSTEPEHYRDQFFDDYNKLHDDFQMPDVRLAATGMDSCPASDEDTEDELESARTSNAVRSHLLPSTSRQLVGESNRPSFRPGLEGGSSDDEDSTGRGGHFLSGIEHRRSAEGQVISSPLTGDGGGGDGSSGSEDSGNDGGVSTIPLPSANVQTTYDVLRGLGIVGSSAAAAADNSNASHLSGHGRNMFSLLTEIGDRVGPVGTGETNATSSTAGVAQRLSPVNWSMVLNRQEALDAMESTESGPTAEHLLDTVYLRRSQNSLNPAASLLQGTQDLAECSEEVEDDDDEIDEPDGARPFLGLRGGPCGDVTGAEASGNTSEDDNKVLSTSLEAKYFSHSFHQEPEDSDDGWKMEFQQGASQNVVYQNEDGEWVTDLAYYSSFEKEVDGNVPEDISQFQTENFVSSNDAMKKILKDQEEFEKEHQFMQEEKIEAANSSSTFNSDSSWKIPNGSHVLMRTSQVSSEFEDGHHSYLRLSLGHFFEQRSEALGCLGSNDDVVKRPSFGYIITSPEKREPFALISPSDLSATAGPHNDTIILGEADKTLNPEDLDKTLEAPPERVSPKGDPNPEPHKREEHAGRAALPDVIEGSESGSTLANQSCVSPDNNSQLMLSISTIASAIADASISTDPSELAAMIMELSKRGRKRSQPLQEGLKSKGPAVHGPHQSALLDTLQSSQFVGEQSIFDMDKYLKKTDVSATTEVSFAHTTFDLTAWAENLSTSQREHSGMASGKRETQPEPIILERSTLASPSLQKAKQLSICSSPGLSRLTYISMNEGTGMSMSEQQKCLVANYHAGFPQNNSSMALSTTIIRFSPTPPVEPDSQSNLDLIQTKGLNQVPPQHSKSLDPLPAHHCKSPDPPQTGSALSCVRSQSECNFHCPPDRTDDGSAGCRAPQHLSDPSGRQLTKVDSGYSSNLNIQHASSSAAPQHSQQWERPGSVSSSAYVGGLGIPVPSYSTEGLHYVPIPNFKATGLIDLPHQGDMQSLLAARSLFTSQIAQQYLAPEAPLHPGAYHAGTLGTGLFALSSTGFPSDLAAKHIPPTSGPLGFSGSHHIPRPHQSQQDIGLLGKPYPQYGVESLMSCQVVVPEELRFPHACCVGIASQTSLSLFNPSERWQQVSISVTSLAINGEKVESLPYQWLMVKNKTIIGPKTTEEQKVLFIPPRAGVYQCVLSVCSWPASAETEVAARANIFAKKVVLVGIAENPAIEVEISKSGCLDFGDLPAGSAKSLPLKLVNRTCATVPIRLVISATATAWRCFTFSKQPVTTTSEPTQQASHMATVSSPSVINHVMHASYEETAQSFMVWVHFRPPLKYTASSEELGLADDYSARVEIEVDSPGPSHVIQSIPLKARSGTARVHAPKDLQTISLAAPLGKSSQQVLPLKNAGNIDVQLKLKHDDAEGSFSVTPDELPLMVGKEQAIMISFKPQCSRKYRESLLTILVLPSGPQYEVTLRGEVVSEDSGKPAIPSAALFGPGVASDVPPILSNKQFVAWGGVTLGRAVQQKLVLRNNSTSTAQQLRLLIRGQDQDCFQAGYGGTSNIILEDQRKQGDGYVAIMSSISVGHVSKVCLCVRNTGSRAAFIKAMAFSDVQTRSIMEPSVISIAPSQFVLKERTQEVITVLMKSTQREQNLCQAASALLATVYLFCGDEVSRQQYKRLLQNKPEAAQKALSDNSLLKNIEFNEKFLGEEHIAETFDLPQRPNEAHIFYGNMSKIVVSLLGSAKSACEQDEHAVALLPSARRSSQTDGDVPNENVSLDVLPVKGPQGPALRVTEPSMKSTGELRRESESWTVHPEQLVMAAPTVAGATTTSQAQIWNNTSRELSFDLSWPAHYLTITPQHGVIDPQRNLQILVSPNPALASKSALLPWSGQIYVQCDGQQKFIKVQIRPDLALDVSSAPANTSLSALPPQAATPVLPVSRLITTNPVPPQSPSALVEINSKTIVFPATYSGEMSEAQLKVQNGEVQGVDNTGDVYRATYTAFRCSSVSGTLGAREKMQVPITFLPRDRGDYAQFWDLECHPVSEPQRKTRVRFQLCGTGMKSGLLEGPQEGDCSLVRTEAAVKTRRRADTSGGKISQEEAVRRGVYSPQDHYTFPATRVGTSSALKVNIRNNSSDMHELTFVKPREPFHVKHSKYSLRSQHYLKLPVQFKPSTAGTHVGWLLIQSQTSGNLVIHLSALGRTAKSVTDFHFGSGAAGGNVSSMEGLKGKWSHAGCCSRVSLQVSPEPRGGGPVSSMYPTVGQLGFILLPSLQTTVEQSDLTSPSATADFKQAHAATPHLGGCVSSRAKLTRLREQGGRPALAPIHPPGPRQQPRYLSVPAAAPADRDRRVGCAIYSVAKVPLPASIAPAPGLEVWRAAGGDLNGRDRVEEPLG